MRLYQPVLFVGLGGTGCDIGAELERRLREEICGPDGNDFRRKPGMDGMLPYQLPSCVQFVYADVDQAALATLPNRVVPGAEHIPASAMTAHYVNDLVPPADSYPDLSMSLRLGAARETEAWLPPEQGEPRVIPLRFGAGQFPTVGRATLFGTFMDGGINHATRDIGRAVGRLSNSGTQLHMLGGAGLQGVDVFLAFSVAGGTGCGLFYDYLHLIGHELSKTQLQAKIYPLVLMPSAFEDGLGGGRPAELNAGRALLDLFRLVDEQNAAAANRMMRGNDPRQPIDREDLAVHYPGIPRIALSPGTAQTGFLFSRPANTTREDMHRSIVSLVTSLIGTQVTAADHRGGVVPQSFADSWVNGAGVRDVPAENGIGNRGVSTSLVASLTVPIDELAGIVAARLLRTAVDQLARPVAAIENNHAAIEDFATKAGVSKILRPPRPDFHEPSPAYGAQSVAIALNDRFEAMRASLDTLRTQLAGEAQSLATSFHPEGTVDEQLASLDVFKVQRILFGHPELTDETDRGGLSGVLNRRRAAPPPVDTPGIPEMRDKRFFLMTFLLFITFRLRKVGWADEAPVACRAHQDEWHKNQSLAAWARAWDAHAPLWRRPLERAERQLNALTSRLLKFARDDREDFERRSAELYKQRVGVSYMLPAGTGRMDQFYEQVIARLRDHRHREGALRPGASEPDLLKTMIGPTAWRETFKMSVEHGPDTAVAFLLEQVKTAVKTFLREPPPGERPMLPRLAALLAESAGHSPEPGTSKDYLEEFNAKLAGLLPANFTPQGSGPLRVLVSYPAGARDPVVEEHLKKAVRLPAGTHDFRNTDTESISVVLFRTSMGITEVGEVRDVLRLWSDSLASPRPADRLKWRQRTGYNFGYLATREEHRVQILHRLLCALWNGKGTVAGQPTSPSEFSVELGGGVTMPLPLRSFGRASSWGNLLQAYELWALDDSRIQRLFCSELMRELPYGLDSTPNAPHQLFEMLRDMAPGQIELLDDLMKKQDEGQRARSELMRSFWADTLENALDWPFNGPAAPVASSLRALENFITEGGADG